MPALTLLLPTLIVLMYHQKKYYRAIFERNRRFLSKRGKQVAQLINIEVRALPHGSTRTPPRGFAR